MHVGLDLGNTGARVLTVTPHHLHGKRISLNYCLLPDTAQQRRHLTQSRINFASCEGSLLLLGQAALEYCRIFRAPPRTLLPFGDLPQHDILGRQILASHIGQLIPNRRDRSEAAICCYSHPRSETNQQELYLERNRFLSQVLHLSNYIPLPISAGMGVVLADLVDQGFSGIAMLFGATCSEMTVAYQGQEIFRASVPLGGDWIDDELARRLDRYLYDDAGVRYPDLQLVRQWRERLMQPLMQPRTKTDQLILQVYAEFLTDTLCVFIGELEKSGSLPDRDWTLVCAGGLIRTNGFRALLQQALTEIEFPLSISQLRSVSQSEFTIARGCLANAFLEARIHHQRHAA